MLDDILSSISAIRITFIAPLFAGKNIVFMNGYWWFFIIINFLFRKGNWLTYEWREPTHCPCILSWTILNANWITIWPTTISPYGWDKLWHCFQTFMAIWNLPILHSFFFNTLYLVSRFVAQVYSNQALIEQINFLYSGKVIERK